MESEEHAKAADASLAAWVKANTTMTSETRITGDLAWLELASSISFFDPGRSSASIDGRSGVLGGTLAIRQMSRLGEA